MSVHYDRAKYSKDLSECVHCGLCLESCPTYLETGNEADSPRGRIVLMRDLHKGDIESHSHGLRRHIDQCLGCRACETACPSGVQYGALLDVARERMNEVRPFAQKLARKTLLDSLTDPAKLKNTLKLSALTGGLPPAVAKLLMGDSTAQPPSLSMPRPSDTAPLPSVVKAQGERRARVGMLTGCVMRVLYDDVNADTVAVLSANGCEVLINQSQGCCGALHGHNGFQEHSIALAKKLIDSFTPFDGLEAIIVNSAGCGSSMKEFGSLLAGDREYAKRANEFSSKCKDVSEFLAELGWAAALKSLPITVTYHDACHLAHAQRVRNAPRALLAKVPDLNIVPLQESDVCCGSAGIYNLTEPAMAGRLQLRKIQNIVETGAKAVVTGNPGCMAWISAGLADYDIPVLHPVSLLRASLAVDPLFSSEQ